MSNEVEFSTCRLDPEIALVEEALPPASDSDSPEISNEDALETLPEAELSRAERAIETLRSEAMALPDEEVESFSANAVLLRQNVDAGYKAVESHLARLEPTLPPEHVRRVKRIRDTALALLFVAAVALREETVKPTFHENLKRLYKKRRLLMRSAEALAEKGLMSAERLALIQAGAGPRDAVGDTVALVAFLRENPKLMARTPVEESDLREASELADRVSERLKVEGSRVEPQKPEPTVNAGLVDRLWTVLKGDWDALFAVGAVVWGTRVTRHISPLQSRARTTRPASESSASAETEATTPIASGTEATTPASEQGTGTT